MTDDSKSSELKVTFGVPQGSILGPVVFNLYVKDLAENLLRSIKSHKYAEDTTPTSTANRPPSAIAMPRYRRLSTSFVAGTCLTTSFLILPKLKLCSSAPNRCPTFTNLISKLTANGKVLEGHRTLKLLGTHIHQHIQLTGHFNKVIKSCYATLSVLRKLKNIATFSVRKHC